MDDSPGRRGSQPQTNRCSACGGAGWVTRRVHITHPDFGSVFPCRCQEIGAEGERRSTALERYSNLGSLRRATFANAISSGIGDDAASHNAFVSALQTAADYAEEPNGWLTLAGPSGSGKTYLAAAIANHQIELGHPALFITAADLLDYLRSGFDDDADTPFVDLFEQVRNAPLLVLDDLPTRPATPWTQERLFQLLAWRHSNRMPTVVTLRGDPSRLDEFLRSRIESSDGFGRLCRLGRVSNMSGRIMGVIPPSMRRRMTFDNFSIEGNGHLTSRERESLGAAKVSTQHWAENVEGRWLNLFGPYGVGKTHLAVAAAVVRENRGDEVFFATVADLLDYLRATFAPDSPVMYDDLLERIKTADLLVMDDMGAERSTPFAEDKLFQIVNYRYEERLPTIITTTQIPDSIAGMRPRIASRLQDKEVVVEIAIEAPDYRQGDARR